MFRKKAFPITAAAAAIVLASTLWFNSGTRFDPNAAFADMIRKVNAFTSVQYVETTQTGEHSNTSRFDLAGDGRSRVGITDSTDTDFPRFFEINALIYNPKEGSVDRIVSNSLTLIKDGEFYATYCPSRKTVSIDFATDSSAIEESPESLLDQIRTIAEDATEFLGERITEGRRELGYRASLPDTMLRYDRICEVWLDAQTNLPVSVVTTGVEKLSMFNEIVGKALKSHFESAPGFFVESSYHPGEEFVETMSDFQWNEPVDPTVFDIVLPDGWQIIDPSGIEPALRAKIAQRSEGGE